MTETHGYATMTPAARRRQGRRDRAARALHRAHRRGGEGRARRAAGGDGRDRPRAGARADGVRAATRTRRTITAPGSRREEGADWFDTGDLGRIDEDGYVWLTGRAKDVIIRGGHNIDPVAIEEALHKHPAVEMAAAIGRPDAYAGEIPIVFVQLKPGASASPEELQAFARERVAERAAAPAEVRVLAQMPLTAVGKIFKPALREIAAKEALEQAIAGLVEGVRVEVAPHPKYGALATVRRARRWRRGGGGAAGAAWAVSDQDGAGGAGVAVEVKRLATVRECRRWADGGLGGKRPGKHALRPTRTTRSCWLSTNSYGGRPA